MDNQLLVVSIFGLVLSVPFAVLFWMRVWRQLPKDTPVRIWAGLAWKAVGLPTMSLGGLLAAVFPSGPLRTLGWGLVGAGALLLVVDFLCSAASHALRLLRCLIRLVLWMGHKLKRYRLSRE